jgi:two-component system, chemotaxis family, sensor kinase CheA
MTISENPTNSLGKYRGLVTAIALFLILDLGVLVFNVLTSQEIEHDAAEINSAGALRMLSQQMTKALLTLEQEVALGKPSQTSVSQVYEASDEFEQWLQSLQRSEPGLIARYVGSGDAQKEKGRMIAALASEWGPLNRDVTALLDKKDALTLDDVAPVSNKAVSRNLKLLQQADDLSQQMEDMARAKALQLRQIQFTAIALALLNFGLIVFKFVGQLNASDRRAAQAQEETKQILDTVHEGLLLLHRDGSIGAQRSASIDELFGVTVPSRAHLLIDVLKPILRQGEQLATAQEYIELLFDKKVKASLLADLNPLIEVEITVADPRRGSRQRFLSFAFDQVERGDEVEALLVSVFDVSQKVLLERELVGAEGRAKSDVEHLLGIIDQDPVLISSFVDGAQRRIEAINRELQAVRPEGAAYATAINLIAGNVHWIKGEAALLRIVTIETFAHQFEGSLAGLRGRRNLTGDDLIPVAVGIGDLLEHVERVSAVAKRVSRLASAGVSAGVRLEDPLASTISALHDLAVRAANDTGKQVRLDVDVPPLRSAPEKLLRVCREVLPQFIRNAVVHGIEHQEERSRHGKDLAGNISIRVELEGASGFRVRVRDDGRGLSPTVLRQRAIEKGWHSAADAARLADQDIVLLMFEPGFTTTDAAHVHAGRGDGLSVVRDVLAGIGARLRVMSRVNSHTEFVVSIPA